MSLIAYGTHALICKLQMEIKKEIKSYLSCSILESAAVRSEMKVAHRSKFKNRTKQVRFYLLFNFRLQFTNKSVGSLC